MRLRSFFFYIIIFIGLIIPVFTFATTGEINLANRFSWLCVPENSNEDCHDHTLVNWRINPPNADTAPVSVSDTGLSGWIFSSTLGWIHLAPTTGSWGLGTNNLGVQNTTGGILSSFAWSSAGSWVNFNPSSAVSAAIDSHGVQIDPATGYFSGWAWIQNYGWMLFDCSDPTSTSSACVSTTWRPTTVTTGGGTTGGEISVPTSSPDPATPYTSTTTISLYSSTASTTIHYIINPSGSTLPACSDLQYYDPITATSSIVIKAIACDSTGGYSSPATFNYTINIPIIVAPPTANPDPAVVGTFSTATSVTLLAQAGTTINYLINPADGTLPDCSSVTYVSPILVASSETIKAVACDSSGNISIPAVFSYVIVTVSDPIASPPVDVSYTSTTTVTLTSTSSVGTPSIYYTNNGTNPSCPNPPLYTDGVGTVFSASFEITAPETIKAISCNGTSHSNLKTFAYNVNITSSPPALSAPQSSLSSGTYTGDQSVFLSSLNSTSIHYIVTADATSTDPDCSSGLTSFPITVSVSETIKAIACNSSSFSSIASFSYVINPSTNTDNGGGGTSTSTATTTTIGLDLSKVNTETSFVTIATTSSPVVNNVIAVANTGITNVSRSVKKTAVFAQQIFSSPTNAAKIEVITTTGAVAGTASGILFSSFSLADLLLIPLRLWSLLMGALGLAKRKKPWGTVYDSVTKQPLDPAYVVLKSIEGEDVATAITDLDGRYGFVVPKPGNYSLFVHKTNYVFPSQKLVGQDHDELYRDLYFGEHFSITESGEFVAKNVPMDPEKFDWNEFAKKSQHLMKFYSNREKWLSRISNFFFVAGFSISALALVFSVTKTNIIIFSLYVVLLFVRTFGLRSRPFGNIVSKDSGKPVAFAIIRISQKATGVEVMHRVADSTGRYYCLLPNGNYEIRIDQKLIDGSYKTIAEKIPAVVSKGYLSEKFIVENISITEEELPKPEIKA